MSEKQCNLIGGGMKELVDLIYPVGHTIIRDHNPQTDYPWQRWEQDFKDRFPIGAGNSYPAGSTGGEAQHTLTVEEMPRHNHGFNRPKWYGVDTEDPNSGSIFALTTGITDHSYKSTTNDIHETGGSQPHNNMPPYKAVSMWTRTA